MWHPRGKHTCNQYIVYLCYICKFSISQKQILSFLIGSPGQGEVMRVQCRALKDDLEGWVTVAGRQGWENEAEHTNPFRFALFWLFKEPAYSYNLHQNSILTCLRRPFLHLLQKKRWKTHTKVLGAPHPNKARGFRRFSISPVVRQHWKQILGRLCWGLQGGQGVVNDKMGNAFCRQILSFILPNPSKCFFVIEINQVW